MAQSQRNQAAWGRYKQGSQVWQYLELGTRCGRWKSFHRALFWRLLYQDAHMVLPFARPDTVVVTNLGMGQAIHTALTKAGYAQWLQGQGFIAGDHGRGSEELVHRALKDFGLCLSSALPPMPPSSTRCWWPFFSTRASSKTSTHRSPSPFAMPPRCAVAWWTWPPRSCVAAAVWC
ncbi:hypothetical protein [Desulfosoma caldarium]|uniref:hypothetical protein n=1 Tax=Desulfosoma caldarium TaxID=610254 RepID=UPI0011CEA091|nr:hypothetical protein [Desulfosoma caldarium]